MSAQQLPEIGMFATTTQQFNEGDVKAFAQLSGDFNPVHLDVDFAAKTLFKRPIVHGILVASQFSKLLAQELPGPGSIYVSQSLQFVRPVYWGDTIVTRVEVIGVKMEKRIVIMRTTCAKGDGELVLDGEAVIKLV